MSELRDLSKLPANPAYWESLEARMLRRDPHAALGAGSGTAGRLDDRSGWWAPLATRAGALSGLAIAAGLAAVLLVPPRTQGAATRPAGLLRLPDDPAMNAFLSAPEPPPLGSLLISPSRSKP